MRSAETGGVQIRRLHGHPCPLVLRELCYQAKRACRAASALVD